MSFITPGDGWEITPAPSRRQPQTQSMQPVSVFCGHCGKQVPANLQFCTACGAAVAVTAQAPAVTYQPPFSQQPYSPFTGFPQPQINQQIVIVQQPSRSGGLGWAIFFVLLFFPLWPITIPILLVVALVKASSD